MTDDALREGAMAYRIERSCDANPRGALWGDVEEAYIAGYLTGATEALEVSNKEIGDAAAAKIEGVTEDRKVFGSPRFAFVWGFAQGVEWLRTKALRAGEGEKL